MNTPETDLKLAITAARIAAESFRSGTAPQEITHPDDHRLLSWLAAERIDKESRV